MNKREQKDCARQFTRYGSGFKRQEIIQETQESALANVRSKL